MRWLRQWLWLLVVSLALCDSCCFYHCFPFLCVLEQIDSYRKENHWKLKSVERRCGMCLRSMMALLHARLLQSSLHTFYFRESTQWEWNFLLFCLIWSSRKLFGLIFRQGLTRNEEIFGMACTVTNLTDNFSKQSFCLQWQFSFLMIVFIIKYPTLSSSLSHTLLSNNATGQIMMIRFFLTHSVFFF